MGEAPIVKATKEPPTVERQQVFWFKFVVAVFAAAFMLRFGYATLRHLARPLPEPPPPGELRKVKILYRCSICGAEMRMTMANDEMPAPPRHCLEDMDLVTPVE